MNITKTLAICLAAALTACGPARPAATPESDAEASAETGASAESAAPEPDAYAEAGTETERGFVLDNVLHSSEGDIHYNLYTPESYDGSEPRALFVTLAGYEGLYFQGMGANLAEDFGFEAQDYDPDMLVLAPQLNDWGETSARQTIVLVEYFLADERRRGDGLAGHGHAPGALCRLPRHQHALGRRPGRPRRITHAGMHGDRRP